MRYELLAAFLASLLMAVPAAAQPDTQYLVCSARNRENTAGYVSGAMAVKPDSSAGAETAWRAMASSKYSALDSSTACMRFDASAAADAKRSTVLDNMQDDGLKITAVEWSYTPPPTPTTAPPAAPATPEQAALAEIPQSKGFCEQNFPGLFDCNCFAQAVLHYRLAHPDEWIVDVDGKRRVPVHDLAVGVKYRLDCTECLDDQRLMAWARKTVSAEFGQMVMTKLMTQAQVDNYANCVAKAFPAKYRANPYLDKYLAAMNQARESCGNPRG
jgi:hypothetical protein